MNPKWIDLCRNLRRAGVYHEARLIPESLAGVFHEGAAVAREDANGSIIAFAALWTTNEADTKELGTVWVHEQHNGNGLMKVVVGELLATISAETAVFFIAKDRRLMRIQEWHGFKPVTTRSFPNLLKWASHVGITQRLPTSVHEPENVPKVGERWLFVR